MINELKVGKIGEDYIFNKLKNYINIKTVIDVRDNEVYREKDIDFILIDKNYKIIFIECKTDTVIYSSRRIAYEVFSTYEIVNGEEKSTPGCFEKTESDFIIYCAYNEYKSEIVETFIFNTKELQKFYKDNKQKFKEIKMGVDKARGVLIPLGFITGNKIGYKYKN